VTLTAALLELSESSVSTYHLYQSIFAQLENIYIQSLKNF